MKHLFANWKMSLSAEESVARAREILLLNRSQDVELVLFPSASAFAAVRDAVNGKLLLGAQDGHPEGATYVLVGHSDRRAQSDADEIVAKKLQEAADAGLVPVLCVGETKAERDAGARDERIRAQVTSALTGARVQKVFIAYEPVWAIGSGQNNTPEDTVSAIAVIDLALKAVASDVSAVYLYGGSVNPHNVASYTHLPALGGVLVGKAGTSSASLRDIMETM
ncbi:MAG: triose-phosphate isomerase family protein [Patescibacteria group bacterium]